jgi:hypothetical protein
MEAQENYKTCRDADGRLYLQYDFMTEDGDLFEAEPCDLTQARRMRDRWQECREKHRCTRCGQVKPCQVEERYSFGIYAGKLCISCCAG